MDMSISKKKLVSQLEPFEKPCFIVVILKDNYLFHVPKFLFYNLMLTPCVDIMSPFSF
jgi:hypothetical protein